MASPGKYTLIWSHIDGGAITCACFANFHSRRLLTSPATAWSCTSTARAATQPASFRPMTPAGAIGSLRRPGFAAPANATPADRALRPAVPKMRPHDLLQVGGPVTLAFLWCSRWIWEIDQAQLDKPQIKRDTLMAVCQLPGIGAAALILPCSLIDLAFDTDFLNMLMQAAPVGVALALMVAVWTDQEE